MYEELTVHLLGEDVGVIVDRRRGHRRQRWTTTLAERRYTERRGRPGAEPSLAEAPSAFPA
ncbi:MAG TPA: hypothetical protein DCQ64_10630 [Candidatus Rokubacteria bacterium]|nr:hypothetical protein [Candidatus Rokubacteria bacterium]